MDLSRVVHSIRRGDAPALSGKQWGVALIASAISMVVWGVATKSWWVAGASAFFGVYAGFGADGSTERWHDRLLRTLVVGGFVAAINRYVLGNP
jgi:hypothetical protein